MTGKTSGLGDHFLFNGFLVGGDISDVAISGGPAPLDVTGLPVSGHERIGGLRDGSIGVTTFHDMGAGQSHAAFSPLLTTDVIACYLRGQSPGFPAANCVARQIGYDLTRAADGSLSFKVDGQGDGFGLEWGLQLTAGPRTDSGATAGTALDNAASSAFGAQAYLQAVSFTGTDVTVKVQHSADNSTWADLITFAQITGSVPLAQRLAVSNSATVNRYLRATTVTTGGFTSLKFAVNTVRNQIAGVVF